MSRALLSFVVNDLDVVHTGVMQQRADGRGHVIESAGRDVDVLPVSKPKTARERARAEVTMEIKTAARAHLAEFGAAGLSLRAVARDVGMVSSAVYRYFPSRDDLLTALIVDAYLSVGAAARAADEAVARTDSMGRWLAIAGSVRLWALGSPHEYGLIFGTPVPGYRAPVDTIDPAVTVPSLLLDILVVSARAGATVGWAGRPMPGAMRRELLALRSEVEAVVDHASVLSEAAIAQGLMAWTQLIGSISFEMFGHLHNVIEDHQVYFARQMRNIGIDLGLAPTASRRRRDASS